MSAQTISEAFAPWEASYKARVMGETWGHLAPKPRNAYRGSILFAQSEYGDLVALRTDFPDLPDSPWLFNDIMEFICAAKTEAGGIYEFEGTYTRRKNGTHHFKGRTVERMPIPERQKP
jgi:hypothetical protein